MSEPPSPQLVEAPESVLSHSPEFRPGQVGQLSVWYDFTGPQSLSATSLFCQLIIMSETSATKITPHT